MPKPTFEYTTYIRAAPDQLWDGLTEPALTKRYWNTAFHTVWRPGATMVWDNQGVLIEDPAQVVLAAEPYSRLAYTWHTFTPELAVKVGFGPAEQAVLAKEPRSKVTFEIVDQQPMAKLTVVHEAAKRNSLVLELVSSGWPLVLASLKTLLETGRAPSEPEL